jgi:hypothetical protein
MAAVSPPSPRRGPVAPADDVGPAAGTLGTLLQLDALLRAEADDFAGAVDRAFEAVALAEDLADRPQAAVSAPLMALTRLVATEALPPGEADRAVTLLTRDLERRRPVWEAWRHEYLAWQVAFRQVIAAEADPLEFDVAGVPFAVDLPLGLGARLPTRGEVADAWSCFREHFADIRRAVESGDDAAYAAARMRLRDAVADAGSGPFGSVSAYVLVAGENALENVDLSRRRREALLLGLFMLREKRRTGAFPTDLAAIRPPAVRKSPGGARWILVTEPGKKPAIRLESDPPHEPPPPNTWHEDPRDRPLFSFR